MSDSWIVSVGGRGYGPYSLEQMQTFIAEGRVAAQSLVAHPSDAESHMAGDDPVLGALFAPATPQPAAMAEPMRAEEKPAQNFGRHGDQHSGEASHIIIIADMKSRSINGLEEEIYNLGPAYPVLPQVWLLTTDTPVHAIRNILMQKLGKLDVLFIIDSTHDKAAWFNFGPESDTRIRRIWGKQEATIKARAG